jgi:hypothetical protein
METNNHDDLKSLSTFDIAFNLATGQYDEKQKFEALAIIRERDTKNISIQSNPQRVNGSSKPKTTKPPLKGSKAEKIFNLLDSGKTVKDVYEMLNKKNTTVYYPEIYRIAKMYWPEVYQK